MSKFQPYTRESLSVDGEEYYSEAAGRSISPEMIELYREDGAELRVITRRYSDFGRYSLAETIEVLSDVLV